MRGEGLRGSIALTLTHVLKYLTSTRWSVFLFVVNDRSNRMRSYSEITTLALACKSELHIIYHVDFVVQIQTLPLVRIGPAHLYNENKNRE